MNLVASASSSSDYLAKKKGLVVNNRQILDTIQVNVEAAEYKGVVVPYGTPEGYVLTVTQNAASELISDWMPSNEITDMNNIWTNSNEFLVPPTIVYPYSDEDNSNQVANTKFVQTVVNRLGLSKVLQNNSVGTLGQSMTLIDNGSTSVLTSQALTLSRPSKQTQYTSTGVYSNDAFTIQPSALTINAPATVNQLMTFNASPQVPYPSIGDDVVNKSYVDTMIGNYSGAGINLYLNCVNTTYTLSNQMINGAFTKIENIPLSNTTPFATFISDFSNLTVIPTGIWAMTLYGYVSSAVGLAQYYFTLSRRRSGVDTVIETSSFSKDMNGVNPTNPDTFQSILTLRSAYTDIVLTDTLVIKLYTRETGASSATLTAYFGGEYYSFVTSSLSGGTSILTMNNTFTGTNTFSNLQATTMLSLIHI